MNQAADYHANLIKQYDQFAPYELPAAIAVAPYLFRKSTQNEDREGIDVVVKYETIAVRTRKFAQDTFDKYKNEFTIRCHVPSGSFTELDKICRGEHAQVMVYCWEDGGKIKEWMLLNMTKVAAVIKRLNIENKLHDKCIEKDAPNDTKFIICKLEDFPGALIASSFIN
jgi:hypothetical protein